jgi:D-sedoheptulose 7-phosphate isomerase
MTDHTQGYFREVVEIAHGIDQQQVDRMIDILAEVRSKGRLFILGVGGGAGHASHAVNDFRKIAGIESYSPADNVSELTARTNDEGWETTYAAWLQCSRLSDRDLVLVFSVGGGDLERNISPNLVRAVHLAQKVGAGIIGIVGRDGGFTARAATACVIVPTVNPAAITPHTEAFQAVVWHLLVAHPRLQIASNKWESQPPSGASGR